MFGLGSICDKLADGVVSEEYRWLADIGCAGLDALTGNYGGAVGLAVKAGSDGAAAAGNRKAADGLSIAGTAHGIVTAEALNEIGRHAADLPTTNGCTVEPGPQMICSDAIARRAAFAGGGAAIGVAKGGKAGDIKEGLQIGGAASGLTDSCLRVTVNPAKDAATLAGNASLLGRDTAAFATAIAVADKHTAAEKRAAGAIGGLVGAAADLPGTTAGLTGGKNDLERLLAAERTAADIASISFDAKTAGLPAHARGRDLERAQTLTEAGLELLMGMSEDDVTHCPKPRPQGARQDND